MIDLDSPVEPVLGGQTSARKRKRIAEGLGLAPSATCCATTRAATSQTGELTDLDDARARRACSPSSARSSSAERQHLPGPPHPAARPTASRSTLRTDGPSLRLTFFAKTKRIGDWHAGRCRSGGAGSSSARSSTFRGQWQLTNPQMVLFGDADDEDAARRRVDVDRRCYPIYPPTKGVDSWDLAARDRARARPSSTSVPDLLPERGPRASTTCSTLAHGAALDPPARHLGAGRRRPSSGSGSTRRS